VPYPKNPVIARVFKEIGWAEELGSGIRNIKKYCKIYSDSKPVFIEGDVFKTIIEIKQVDKNLVMTEKVAEKVAEKLTSAEKAFMKLLLPYFNEHEWITNTEPE